MNLLITGGIGFIGTNAALYFHHQGHRVTCLDNYSRHGVAANAAVLEKLGIPIIKADVANVPEYVSKLKQADAILHLAGQTAVTTSIKAPIQDFQNNLVATLNLLEAVRLHRPQAAIIFSSTNKVYGNLDTHDYQETATKYLDTDAKNGITELQPLSFISPYGCSKGAADQYISDYARIFGLNTIVFRQSCIYGPFQQGVEDQGWIAHFSKQALSGKDITVFGNGKQVRDLLFVEDLLKAYDLALQNISLTRGKTYNIGGGVKNAYSLLEVLSLLEKELNQTIKVTFENPRLGDQKVFISDNTKLSKDLAWQPQTRFTAGLTKLIEWQRQFLSS